MEDHPLVRDAFVAQVGTHFPGAQIVYAGAVIDQALAAIKILGCDCIVLDLDLGDGRPPMENVAQACTSGAPVLVVSGLGDPALVHGALVAGAHGYVSKNADTDEIVAAIQSTVDGEEYVSHELGSHMLNAAESTVHLSEQERRAMVLYASGLKMSAVARRMDVSVATAQEYIKRVRSKYLKAGNPLPTKLDMYHAARDRGLLN